MGPLDNHLTQPPTYFAFPYLEHEHVFSIKIWYKLLRKNLGAYLVSVRRICQRDQRDRAKGRERRAETKTEMKAFY